MEEDKGGGWPVEDDYDALNDETFGGDGEEFNWDDQQNMFGDIAKDMKLNGKSHQREEASTGYSHPELDPADLVDDYDHENALEESISRLVMDAFDDDEDDSEISARLEGIGSKPSTYFLPPQVANRQLWFMDKDLPGGNSLLGPSVWSMHSTTAAASDAPTKSMNHQQSGSVGMSDSNYKPPPGLPMGSRIPDIKANMPPHLGSGSALKSGSQKPVFKTVEEIEKEMLEASAVSAERNLNHVDSKPPSSNRPKVMTAEELERELLDGASATPPSKAMNEIPPALRALQQEPRSPPDGYGPAPSSPGPLFMMPAISPGHALNMRMMMQQRMASVPSHMAQNPAFAQRMMGNVQIHSNQQLANMAAYQQRLRMAHSQVHQLRGRLPGMMPSFPGGSSRGGFPMPHPNQRPLPEHFMRRQRDPYCGLMNEKDKQRLRNIQIVQLQNDHPYTTDYYSLMYVARHGGGDAKRQRDCLLKLFPRKSDGSNSRRDYQPAHFENSLGKLQAVSALAPKKAIDTVIRVVDAGPTNRSGMKAFRYKLLEIERLYDCLLKIQEADIRKTLLLNAEESILELRNECERKVKALLQCPEKLSEILSVQKGKMLVSRLMPLMETPCRFFLLSHIIRHFDEWAACKGQEIDQTYPYLRHCVLSAEIPNLIQVFNESVSSKVYDAMLQTKLGVSLVLTAFHRGETLVESLSPSTDEKVVRDLRAYFDQFEALVEGVLRNMTSLPTPIELPTTITKHMERWGYTLDQMVQLQSVIGSWEKQSTPII